MTNTKQGHSGRGKTGRFQYTVTVNMDDNYIGETGNCQQCGHLNRREWALCDACGARLPWAPAKQVKGLNDLSDDQLGALFSPKQEPVLPWRVGFIKSWQGKVVLGLVASLIWELLNRLFFHLY